MTVQPRDSRSARSASARAQSGGSCRDPGVEDRHDVDRDDLGRRFRPDPVEIEPQDKVRIEDEPSSLVVREGRSEDLAQEGEGDRQVEVVVDGGHEPVVEGTALGAQWRRRVRCPVSQLEGVVRSAGAMSATPVATPSTVARYAGAQDRRRGPRPVRGWRPEGPDPGPKRAERRAAAAIERSEYSSLRE